MDWKLAKNYTIILLIILNFILFGANIFKNTKYKITNSQKQAIRDYLKKNNIINEANFSSYFYPLQQIKVKPINFDYFDLQNIFFSITENIKRTEEFNNTIFSNDTEKLTIYENEIVYENNNSDKDFEFNKSNILKICSKYINNIKKHYVKLSLDKITEKEDYFLVQYKEKFKKYKIFNNYADFKIYKNGNILIKFYTLNSPSFFSQKIDICSPDEAIYIFSQKIKELYPLDKIIIEEISLGYYVSEINNEEEVVLTPHYQFLINTSNEPFYINAYSKTLVE